MRLSILSLLFGAALAVGVARADAASAVPDGAPAKHPNVLFFLIDDMGYQDFSCYGSTRVKTPNFDRLAKEGVKFTQFYVSAPICSPSRTAFTTGQYPSRWGITSYLDNRALNARRGINNWLDPKAPVLARTLHDAGYYTAHVGKWHMGGQRDVGEAPHIETYGFDRAITTFEGLANERILPTFEPYDPKDPYRYPQVRTAASLPGPFKNMPRYKVSTALVDRALDEMKVAREQHKPFYINLWPDDVHSPNEAAPEDRGDNSPPENYLGVLKELDQQFGRLMDTVRNDPELRDNTIIIVASDNGPELPLGSAGPLRGSKGQLYEGGIHLPLIVWSPKYVAKEAVGTTNDKTLLCGIDFAPTVLALTGVQKPADVKYDGLDMHAAFLGEAEPTRPQPAMWVRPPDRPGPAKRPLPDLAIRDGNWKLLVARDGSRAELFDIKADPFEKNNLADQHADLVQKMTKQVVDWDKAVEVKADH